MDAVAETVEMIIAAPAVSRLEAFENPRLSGVRSIGVNGYPSIRLYYLTTQ